MPTVFRKALPSLAIPVYIKSSNLFGLFPKCILQDHHHAHPYPNLLPTGDVSPREKQTVERIWNELLATSKIKMWLLTTLSSWIVFVLSLPYSTGHAQKWAENEIKYNSKKQQKAPEETNLMEVKDNYVLSLVCCCHFQNLQALSLWI